MQKIILLVIALCLLCSVAVARPPQQKLVRLDATELERQGYEVVVTTQCWNGVIDNIWPQIFAYYKDQPGSFTVKGYQVKKFGESMLITFDKAKLTPSAYGEFRGITVEYPLKPNCRSGFGWDTLTK